MTVTVIETLDAMLALYAVPGTWTQAGVAQDATGREVAATSPEAVAWSLEGALDRVIGDVEDPDVAWSECVRRQTLLCDVFKACGADLAALNDTVRHQRLVVEVLRHGRDHVLTWERDRAAA